MSLELYYMPTSSACRSVLMVAKHLNIKLNLKYLDLQRKAHLKPEFLKLNPQHTIPTLVDNNFVIWESRVIITYLTEKYARNDKLYPKDPNKRALINLRLFFDLDVLFPAFMDYYKPIFTGQPADAEKLKRIHEVFELLDNFLADSIYVAGSVLSIADYATVATISSYDAANFMVSDYKNIQRWYRVMQEEPGYSANTEGCKQLKILFAWRLLKNNSAIMSLDLYYMPISPPCQSVLMVAKVLKLKLNLKQLNVLQGEHKKPEFLKLNPQHTIPTLVDSNFVVWESRVILSYLVEKYARNDSLYPKNPRERALVNHRLYFDLDTLYQGFKDYYIPTLVFKKPADPEKYKQVENAFGLLDTFLEGEYVNEYVAGPKITIADYAIMGSVNSFEAVGFDITPYKNVLRWFGTMQNAPGYEESLEGYNGLKAAKAAM